MIETEYLGRTSRDIFWSECDKCEARTRVFMCIEHAILFWNMRE